MISMAIMTMIEDESLGREKNGRSLGLLRES